jgi:hypothetical protein
VIIYIYVDCNGSEIGQVTSGLLSLTRYDSGEEAVVHCQFVKNVKIWIERGLGNLEVGSIA